MSPSRKYFLVAIVLSAVMSLQVSAHNHAGEKPTRDPVNVVAMTLPEIVSGLRTCLLYTSPSPRDRQKSRMPSSA